MRRRTPLAVVCALALALLVPATALATPPEDVAFNGTFVEGAGTGTFYNFPDATCASGTTEDVYGVAAGFQSERKVQLILEKVFTCASGGDTFTLLLTVHLQLAPEYANRFTWVVADGTGHFARMHGTGTGTAIGTATGGIDFYEGQLHWD